MAKNKRATALFEVMSRAKLPNKPGSGLPTPKWWFRSTNRSEVRTLAPGQTVAPTPTPAQVTESVIEPPPQMRVVATDDGDVPDYPADVDRDPTLGRDLRAEREQQRELQRERERQRVSLASSI